MAGVLAFKLAVRDSLFRQLKTAAVERVSKLANEANDFINYCATNFPATKENAHRCAVGILAKVDSQIHPENYKAYNMDSMFDVRLCAGRIIKHEAETAKAQPETDAQNNPG